MLTEGAGIVVNWQKPVCGSQWSGESSQVYCYLRIMSHVKVKSSLQIITWVRVRKYSGKITTPVLSNWWLTSDSFIFKQHINVRVKNTKQEYAKWKKNAQKYHLEIFFFDEITEMKAASPQ